MNIQTVRAPNPGPFTLDGTNSYVIDGRTIIDPGPDIESHLDALVAAAPQLETILVTHRHSDHAGGVAALQRKTGAAVRGPGGFEDGAMHAGVEAIATPGHTEEHVCFLTPAGDLFTGDTILGSGTTAIFPPDGRMGDYLASLRKLLDRKPRAIYPGHGPVRTDAEDLIGQYIQHRELRNSQIRELLAAGTRSIPELRTAIYPGLAPGLERAAESQLEAHLLYLMERGEANQRAGRWHL
jgi:glyoxylase-like metal-dependent hydrolase (beta-lactamase superfamily II)